MEQIQYPNSLPFPWTPDMLAQKAYHLHTCQCHLKRRISVNLEETTMSNNSKLSRQIYTSVMAILRNIYNPARIFFFFFQSKVLKPKEKQISPPTKIHSSIVYYHLVL